MKVVAFRAGMEARQFKVYDAINIKLHTLQQRLFVQVEPSLLTLANYKVAR